MNYTLSGMDGLVYGTVHRKKIDGVISMTQFVPQTVLKKFILNL
jgi:hypothetical protein